MEHRRPDPDELLARVQAEEARRSQGKLKVFFGAAPGVGKTYTMLEAARARKAEGIDIIVGWVETHGRQETEALLEGLEGLPRRQLSYRGTRLEEFDLDLALERRPTLIVVDELAHTNAPGSRHTKRYRDVEELLAAGIDVYTTLNVQHLETLNDVVAQVTGVTVRETIPDAVLDRADEIELVDLPAEELRKRLAEGKVYMPEVAGRAAENFFREGNLIALRELALRRTAERVDAQMQRYRREHAVRETWPTAERVLVCVGPSPYAVRLIRAARRMAARLQAEWLVVYVETPAQLHLAEADREQLESTLRLAEQLGAETVTLTGSNEVEEVLAYARRRNVTKLVVGKPAESRWRELLHGSFVDRLVRGSGEIDVYVITGAAGDEEPRQPTASKVRSRWPAYGFAVLIVGLCTLLAALLGPRLTLANLVMVYLVGVVVVALRSGRGPAALSSVLSVAAFDFFFVPPRLTFAVADTQYVLTFVVMLAVALVISGLTARVRDQVEAARARERRTAALYAVSRACASAAETYEVVRVAGRHLAEVFECQVAIFLPHRDGKLTAAFFGNAPFASDPKEASVAQWAFDHGEKAGFGTATLPGSGAIYVPLKVARGPVGVVGVKPGGQGHLDSEQLHLLDAFANQIALAVERTNLAAEAQAAELQVESERMRSALLASVSHDLRTPLAAIAGSSSTLLRGGENLSDEARRELLESINEQAGRLNRFIANLLDMTRLDAGAITVRKEWQPVEEVVGAAIGQLEERLAGREVRARIPESLPLVPLDTTLIGQALVNLLENAVKYTPAGSPIDVAARVEGDSVVIEVADRGPGLAAGEEVRVFDRFHRLPSETGQPGAGLGLAICKAIAAAHGGNITAANRPGGGSVFSLRLPLGGPAPELQPEGRADS
ncbi:MAG: two-component system sensor histidine kinase KdbD [Acidobacteria bacterium RBG_13_68_16]|nr:MAG: two-component system sensor histidine kinase KdbD [Acidobacteria bacterium RBG_13_68_16]